MTPAVSKPTKVDLLDMQRDIGLDEIDPKGLEMIQKLVPLEFSLDKRGNISSTYLSRTVLVDNEHSGSIKDGEMWICRLKSGTSYYYAVPIAPVDERFLAIVMREDHCKEFMNHIFDNKKGIKPKYAPLLESVMDEITKSTMNELKATNAELTKTQNSALQKQQMIETLNERQSRMEANWKEEKEKLDAQINTLKESTNIEGSKEDKKQIEALLKENLQLKKDKTMLEKKVEEANGTNKSLKQSYEESLAKADEDVKIANKQREAVAESKQKMMDEYEARIKELESKQVSPVDPEEIDNLNAFIEDLQIKLDSLNKQNQQLLDDYTSEKSRADMLAKALDESGLISNNSSKTLEALQKERKALMGKISEKEGQITSLSEEIDRLRGEIQRLNAEGPKTRQVPIEEEKPAKTWINPAFRVKRVGGDAIESDWFTEDRYSVMMKLEGNQLLIRPDPRGYVSCKDYVLHIANLESIVPFTKSKSLTVLQNENEEEILVSL